MKTLKCMLLIISVTVSSQAFANTDLCVWLKNKTIMGVKDHRFFLDKLYEAYEAVPRDQNQIDQYESLQKEFLDDATKYSTVYLALCKD